jgi:hypothetical protein
MLLVGLVGGAATAVVAGARRTDTAYQRFLATHAPSAVNVVDSSDFVTKQIDLDAVAALPTVETSARVSILPWVGRTSAGRRVTSDDMNAVARVDRG